MNDPTPGTRFTYTVFNETSYAKKRTINEQWTGTVLRAYGDCIGALTVDACRDDTGETMTFWNDSWNVGSLYESIEVHT